MLSVFRCKTGIDITFSIFIKIIVLSINCLKTSNCLCIFSIVITIMPLIYAKTSILFCSITISCLSFRIKHVKVAIDIQGSIRRKSIIRVANFLDTIFQKCSILYIITFSFDLRPAIICKLCCDSFLVAEVNGSTFCRNCRISGKISPVIKIILISINYLKTGNLLRVFSVVMLRKFIIYIPLIYIKASICFCSIVFCFLGLAIPNIKFTILMQNTITVKAIVNTIDFLDTVFQNLTILYVITISIKLCPTVITKLHCNSVCITIVTLAILSGNSGISAKSAILSKIILFAINCLKTAASSSAFSIIILIIASWAWF